jgi:hypothetical protein
MALTQPTTSEVKAVIILPAGLADETIQLMIDQATVVAEMCPAIEAQSTRAQKSILMWLAAHLLAVNYGKSGPTINKSLGDASEGYAAGVRMFGAGLSSTMYGQNALLLEPTGCLEKLGKLKPVFRSL